MKKQVIQSILILILILCPVLSHAAFDGTRPRDNDLLKDSAALIRTNFNALKDMIDNIYINYSSTDSVALKADKIYVDSNFSTTKEVELILFNLGTFETRLDSIENNILDMIQPAVDMLFANIETLENSVISNYNEFITNMQTHEAELAAITSEIGLITTNLETVEDRLDSIETNILSMIQPAIDLVIANIETLEALVLNNYDLLLANFETHEAEIIALKVNDTTQEVRLVRATAAHENRYKKMILQYGYPIAINDLWDVNKAASVYAMYDIVVFGDLYEKETHEANIDTVNIITKLKELKTDVEVFGYVAIGGELGANLDTTEIYLRIDEWLATGATGIFLDEFGYDYLVTRERQNMAIDYAHSKGMNVIANAWNIDWVFNNDDGYVEWEEFYGNPNLVAPSINSDDYYLFENLFYYYENGQKASDQWRIFEVYRYYYDSATSTWGKNYYDQFGTKTLGLDGIQSTNASKDLYFINAYVGGRIINLDGYGASIELWGSSSTAYNHYNPSFFNNEASMFHRDKIQPTVSDYTGTTYAQYDTKINGVTVKLIWKPGANASNPTLGTHKVQINGVDRTKTYVSSSATNTNTASTLVARDASGNFSAGTITAALAGNASTATKLATAKNIAGTAFDGSLDIDISHNNLINIGLRSHDDIDAAFNTIEIELSSISVAINNLDLRLSIIELALSGGISRVYIDGVALPTGEVEFVSGDNVTLNVSGSTVEVVATGGGGVGGTTAPVQILSLPFTTPDYQVLTVSGEYDTSSILITVNGLQTAYTSVVSTDTVFTLSEAYTVNDSIEIWQYTGYCEELVSGTGTFNGSTGVTISIGRTMNSTDYMPFITMTSDSGGTVGDIWITDKTTTNFKVKCAGSNTTATFSWAISQRNSEYIDVVYSKEEVDDTVENYAYSKAETDNTIAIAIADISVTGLSDYYTKAQTESTVAVMINNNAQAKYWYANNMVSGDFTGEVIIDGMAASATFGQCLYLASGGWTIADADSLATMPALGLCIETGTGNRKILTRGIVKNSGWSFTKGQLIYVSQTAGAITATAPTAATTQRQKIGVALSSDTVLFIFDATCVEN